ncbi:MAG: PGDYG domain-containing protein [Candidatus Obscuribacterales bacterium]
MTEVATAPPSPLSKETAQALVALQQELHGHKQQDDDRSYLGKAFDWVYRSDEKSYSEMERLANKVDASLKNNDFAAVEKMRDEIRQAVEHDQKVLGRQNDIAYFGSTGLKIGALFLGGPLGWGATAGLYMLDAARPKDSYGMQAVDAGLGLAKGLAFKGLIGATMTSQLALPFKAGIMSFGGRALDTALTSQNYYDAKNQQYSLWTGVKATGAELTDVRHLAIDAAVMGTAYVGSLALTKVLSMPSIAASPFYTRVGSSAISGISRGAITEMAAYEAAGVPYNWSRILQRSLLTGTVYGLAAVPGALQAEAAAARASHDDSHQGDGHDGNQFQYREYRKLGTVKAEQLQKPADWTTAKGDAMHGDAGDWKVTGPDGSTWTVKPDIFAQTYSEVSGSPGVFAKTAITRALQLTGPTTIKTLEGTGTGDAGDYLVVGPKGEQYIVTQAKFESMYQATGTTTPIPDMQLWQKQGQVQAEQLQTDLTWKSSNGDTLHGEAGDWKLTSPTRVWTVKPEIFAKTYTEVAPGVFEKTLPAKAAPITGPMTVQTREGVSSGVAGDYLVIGPDNDPYIVPKAEFEGMYLPYKSKS